jgi:hypothetical protein
MLRSTNRGNISQHWKGIHLTYQLKRSVGFQGLGLLSREEVGKDDVGKISTVHRDADTEGGDMKEAESLHNNGKTGGYNEGRREGGYRGGYKERGGRYEDRGGEFRSRGDGGGYGGRGDRRGGDRV